jgi:hypothetical protein
MTQVEANRLLGKVDERTKGEISELSSATGENHRRPLRRIHRRHTGSQRRKEEVKVIVKIFGRGTEEWNFMQVEKLVDTGH